jgi:hypothetical protein
MTPVRTGIDSYVQVAVVLNHGVPNAASNVGGLEEIFSPFISALYVPLPSGALEL